MFAAAYDLPCDALQAQAAFLGELVGRVAGEGLPPGAI